MVVMTTLVLDPVAAQYLDAVHERDSTLSDRIEDSLDALEGDATVATYRRHLLRLPGRPDLDPVRAYSVRGGQEEVMVVWHQVEEVVRIVYIGPSIF